MINWNLAFCEISWINKECMPTADQNVAVAIAEPWRLNAEFGKHSSFYICKNHLERGLRNYSKDWTFKPLPWQTKAWEVRPFQVEHFVPLSKEIIDSIRSYFGNKFPHVIRNMTRGYNYWFVNIDNVFYGIEDDGYIHT